MKFQFQFESVLKVRRHQEKEEQQKLATLTGKQAQLDQACRGLYEKIQAVEVDAVAGQSSGSVPVTEVRRQYEQQHSLRDELWALQDEQRELAEAIDEQRKQLMEANRKTKILEKLKSRERAKFLKEQQQIEQNQQNEIATQIYNRTQ